MPVLDYPDWTLPVTQVNIEGLAGLEELATRLGSIIPWDMKGNVMLMEDFESELTEWIEDSSVGTSNNNASGYGNPCVTGSPDLNFTHITSRSSRHKYSGDWSLKLYNAGGVDKYARRKRWVSYGGASKYGFFTRYGFDNSLQIIQNYLQIYTTPRSYFLGVRYNYLTSEIQVWTTGNAWVTVATGVIIAIADFIWLPFLFTFDTENGIYDKVSLGSREYDISSYPFFLQAISDRQKIRISVGSMSTQAGAFTSYADDVILVKNVP